MAMRKTKTNVIRRHFRYYKDVCVLFLFTLLIQLGHTHYNMYNFNKLYIRQIIKQAQIYVTQIYSYLIYFIHLDLRFIYCDNLHNFFYFSVWFCFNINYNCHARCFALSLEVFPLKISAVLLTTQYNKLNENLAVASTTCHCHELSAFLNCKK